jgi:hypothetical protein
MAIRWLVRTTLMVLLSVGIASTAMAQCGGLYQPPCPGMTTTAKPSYGHGTAIAVGAGVAAAAVVGILVYRHHHSSQGEEASVMGCTQQANGVTTLVDDSTKTTYSLTSLSKDVKPGERVELTGRKSQDTSGKNTFHVQKLVKDDGPCTPQTASAGAGANP